MTLTPQNIANMTDSQLLQALVAQMLQLNNRIAPSDLVYQKVQFTSSNQQNPKPLHLGGKTVNWFLNALITGSVDIYYSEITPNATNTPDMRFTAPPYSPEPVPLMPFNPAVISFNIAPIANNVVEGTILVGCF